MLYDFYSRASCEARRIRAGNGSVRFRFLLTRLLRGATDYRYKPSIVTGISTHAPLARRDLCVARYEHTYQHFYSRASCEARRIFSAITLNLLTFLLTRLLRGATTILCETI